MCPHWLPGTSIYGDGDGDAEDLGNDLEEISPAEVAPAEQAEEGEKPHDPLPATRIRRSLHLRHCAPAGT